MIGGTVNGSVFQPLVAHIHGLPAANAALNLLDVTAHSLQHKRIVHVHRHCSSSTTAQQQPTSCRLMGSLARLRQHSAHTRPPHHRLSMCTPWQGVSTITAVSTLPGQSAAAGTVHAHWLDCRLHAAVKVHVRWICSSLKAMTRFDGELRHNRWAPLFVQRLYCCASKCPWSTVVGPIMSRESSEGGEDCGQATTLAAGIPDVPLPDDARIVTHILVNGLR